MWGLKLEYRNYIIGKKIKDHHDMATEDGRGASDSATKYCNFISEFLQFLE